MHSKIKNELINLGVNPQRIGFEYLTDVTQIILSKVGSKALSMDREVYPVVAKKYSVSVSAVKSAIENIIGSLGFTTTSIVLDIAIKLGFEPRAIPIRCCTPWTPELDKIILNHPKWGTTKLNSMPEFKGKGQRTIRKRRQELLGIQSDIRPRKTHYQNAKDEQQLIRPSIPKPNVTIGQELTILGRRCKVVYIHPEGLFYQVIFANGIRETVNRSEFNKSPYISWLSKPSDIE